MTDSLRDILVYICKDVCPMVLSEDETEQYPYAVFDMTTSPLIDKDGVFAYTGDCKIRVVSNNPDDVDTKAAAIQSAITSSMRSSTLFSRLDDSTKECVDGIWTYEMNYTLKQYADWAEPVENNEQNTQ